MFCSALAIAALAAAAVQPQPGYLNRYESARNVIECPASTNGRLWLNVADRGCEQPGPAAYGAIDQGETVYARIGGLTVGFSPWQRWNDESYPMHESARQNWLKDHGYTGGVRTFRNDIIWDNPDLRAEGETPVWKREIKPRLILPMPEDMPRLRSRMQVDAGKIHEAIARFGAPQRVAMVLPQATSLAAR